MDFLKKLNGVIFVSIFSLTLGWSAIVMAIPNLHEVSENLFRGGRPINNDLESLQKSYGIHTIVDLEKIRKFLSMKIRLLTVWA